MTEIGTSEEKRLDTIQLPLMSLREVVMFPRSIIPLFVGREASIKAIEHAIADSSKEIFLVAQREPEMEVPEKDDLFEVGTVSKVLQMLRLPDGTIKVLFEGLYRARWTPAGIEKIEAEDGSEEEIAFVLADVTPVDENDIEGTEAEALARACHESLEEYAKINKKLAQETLLAINAVSSVGKLADAIMPHLKVDYRMKQEVLELTDPVQRLEKVYELLQGEIAITSMEKRIKNRVKHQMERNQKEYYLNEQIKAINKEMGRDDDPQEELNELETKLRGKEMPEEALERGLRELKKLRGMPASSAEYTVVRNYIDWIVDLPWNNLKDTPIDIEEARSILDTDHFGLEKPKERILEFLAVQKLATKLKGPILCLVGPPGVGKTSLARSIARATNRDFVRLSLGGVRDEAEIRGHRRTYVGALPGKIIQSLKRVDHNNPLFCLDEIDKMSTDFRGDPSAALLEVLDPEQNGTFNDHYLDLDYDLSQVFFITTANSLQSIPLPLQDRMEIIQLPGYLETEKKRIARDFLLPKQIEQHGIKSENLRMSDNVIMDIIRYYTREAGVRNLEREIASICRKAAMRVVEADDMDKLVSITTQNLPNLLGVKKYRYGEREDESQVGVTTGLAWTELGGELLMVETAIMPGSGKVSITGKLGEVMTESAQAALSYIRSRSGLFGLKPDFHKSLDIHVHVPEGATPKDGPSAGITLCTSMVSALLGIPVRNDIAMTGEITLRGRVLPIGGLREKLLAARRGLITTVLIPKDNEKDLKDIPADVLRGMKIISVENVDEVLPYALAADSEDIYQGKCQTRELLDSLKICEPEEAQVTH
ncbi:endopeptidase La [Halodesulfovibrio spirochaetisodalis]|uniref:Lon protease n=1 Tax=Halodesulfovibrio spirochaetisodalis TaxID=1560234 RepID=A0A1B7XQ09_9BACT|nr:endopeptidase La [Halodesulfovibrio spirochaetisodalis]OBQ57602.1 DNA-binding protein [Halodesulfovibrio spirochaetisodalis]